MGGGAVRIGRVTPLSRARSSRRMICPEFSNEGWSTMYRFAHDHVQKQPYTFHERETRREGTKQGRPSNAVAQVQQSTPPELSGQL